MTGTHLPQQTIDYWAYRTELLANANAANANTDVRSAVRVREEAVQRG